MTQIAELELYTKDLEKGYQISHDGLSVINDIRHGEFDLHNNYFSSLLTANSAISSSNTVSACRQLIQYVQSQILVASKAAGSGSLLNPPEQAYVRAVLSSLQEKTSEDGAELNLLTASGHYSLQDQQRQARIDEVKTRLEDKYAFIKSFSAQLGRVSGSRSQELDEATGIKNMYLLK
ncbi:hypothetical protein ACQ86N_02500 [Puia sp. P3]|uniref:hypothetical protein n=1 Tax=Puia sp. P3 TaxID=3423952 RepID=UPI003D66DD79